MVSRIKARALALAFVSIQLDSRYGVTGLGAFLGVLK